MNDRIEKYAGEMLQQMDARPYSSVEYAMALGRVRGVVSQLTAGTDAEKLAEIADILAAVDQAQAEFDRSRP